jgi:Uma2 family endonuclease
MGETARRRATYEDVLASPAHVVAEVIAGTLYTQARPRLRHARASSRLGAELTGPFDKGVGGPGGWIVLDEPELHLGAEPDIMVPDIAGWRRTTLPELPDAAFLVVAPDWVCEVISPSTERIDRADKVPVYAREGVAHVWLLDPDVRTLEVLRLDGETYRVIETFRDDAACRVEPFEAVEIQLATLWAR